MKKFLSAMLLLYLVALHTSMAAMEIIGWTLTACALVTRFRGEGSGYGYVKGYQERYRKERYRLVKTNRVLIAWSAALVIAVLIPLLIEPQEKGILFQFGHMRWVLLLWGLALALEESWQEKFETRWVAVWAVMTLVTGAYGFLQCLTAIDFIRQGKIYPQGEGLYKAVGFFSFSLTFAYTMGLSLIGIVLPVARDRGKWTACLVALFGSLGLMASMSRGAWIAAIAVTFIYLLFNRPKWVIPSALAALAFGAALIYRNAVFADKFNSLFHFRPGGSENLRLNLWQGYWAMFLDHPFFGVGLLAGDKLLPSYFKRLGIEQEFVSHAHNNFLQFLAGAGIFGWICYLAIVFIFLRKAWNLRWADPVWGWSLFLAQLFLHIGGLTEANFINTAVNHFLLVIFALTLVLEARTKSPERV